MFKFLVNSQFGTFRVAIDSPDWFTLGDLTFIDDDSILGLFKEAFTENLLANGRSPYGQPLESIEYITPQDFDFSCNITPYHSSYLYEGTKEEVPLDPIEAVGAMITSLTITGWYWLANKCLELTENLSSANLRI